MNGRIGTAFSGVALSAALLAVAIPVFAAPERDAPRGAATQMQVGEFTVDTDSLKWNLKSSDFNVPRKFHATKPGTDVTSDSATGNTTRKTITMTGNVVVHQTGPSAVGGQAASKLGSDPSTLTANEVAIDGSQKVYTATGNVKYVQGSKTVIADKGVLNENTHILDLTGHVHVADGDQKAQAETIRYNTQTEDVEMNGGVLIQGPVASPPAAPIPAGTPAPKRRR